MSSFEHASNKLSSSVREVTRRLQGEAGHVSRYVDEDKLVIDEDVAEAS